MAIIELINISKVYKDKGYSVEALRSVNLSVNAGEMLAIMGESGSGKSTLLKIIGTVDNPTSGQYLFNGIDISKESDKSLAKIRNNQIGFVFQNFALLERESVEYNIRLPMKIKGISRNLQDKKVNDILGKIGLSNKRKKIVTRLSGGERQRVAIARGMINEPDLLLADEPTGALDSETGKLIMDLLKRINELGTTVIIVTHNIDIAKQCDRIIKIKDGKICYEKDYI